MENLTYKEFCEKYKKPNRLWKFNQFKIVCVKCNSSKVEFNSTMEQEVAYYEGESENVNGEIVVKCHKCGNAFTLNFQELEK